MRPSNEHNTDPDNGQEGQNAHYHAPQKNRFKTEKIKYKPAENPLYQPSHTVTDQYRSGHIFELLYQFLVLVIRKGGKVHDKSNQAITVYKKIIYHQEHEKKGDEKIQDVRSNTTGLLVKKQANNFPGLRGGIMKLLPGKLKMKDSGHFI